MTNEEIIKEFQNKFIISNKAGWKNHRKYTLHGVSEEMESFILSKLDEVRKESRNATLSQVLTLLSEIKKEK